MKFRFGDVVKVAAEPYVGFIERLGPNRTALVRSVDGQAEFARYVVEQSKLRRFEHGDAQVPSRLRKAAAQTIDLFESDRHVSLCGICGTGGRLLMCDRCVNCAHPHCLCPVVDADTMTSEWRCHVCRDAVSPYTAAAALQRELQHCLRILEEQDTVNRVFFEAVALRYVLPTYAAAVERPVDLQMISAKISHGCYLDVDSLEADVNVMVSNCVEFNQVSSPPLAEYARKFGSDAKAALTAARNRLKAQGVVLPVSPHVACLIPPSLLDASTPLPDPCLVGLLGPAALPQDIRNRLQASRARPPRPLVFPRWQRAVFRAPLRVTAVPVPALGGLGQVWFTTDTSDPAVSISAVRLDGTILVNSLTTLRFATRLVTPAPEFNAQTSFAVDACFDVALPPPSLPVAPSVAPPPPAPEGQVTTPIDATSSLAVVEAEVKPPLNSTSTSLPVAEAKPPEVQEEEQTSARRQRVPSARPSAAPQRRPRSEVPVSPLGADFPASWIRPAWLAAFLDTIDDAAVAAGLDSAQRRLYRRVVVTLIATGRDRTVVADETGIHPSDISRVLRDYMLFVTMNMDKLEG